MRSLRAQNVAAGRASCRATRSSVVAHAIKLPSKPLNIALAGLSVLASSPMAKAADIVLPSDIALPDLALPSDITSLVAENPAVVGGAAVAVAVAVVASVLSGGSSKPKAVATSVDQALDALSSDENTILVDIRSKADVKVEGTPDIRATKKKLLSLPYILVNGEEATPDEAFATKFASLPGITPESIIILIDSTGQEASQAATALLASEDLPLQKLYYVKGGAAAWQEQGAPWRPPSKGLDLSALSLPSLSLPALDASSLDRLAESYKANPSAASALLSLAAIGGVAAFVISEFEVILEVAGVVGVGQFLLRSLLFAEDRERTLKSIKSLLNDKIGAGEATEELKKLAATIIESRSAEDAAQKLQEATAAAAEAAAPAPAAEAEEPAAAASSVPESVAEARRWIAAYEARSAELKAEAVPVEPERVTASA